MNANPEGSKTVCGGYNFCLYFKIRFFLSDFEVFRKQSVLSDLVYTAKTANTAVNDAPSLLL